MQTCGHCQFWVINGAAAADAIPSGQCKRHAPQCAGLVQQTHPLTQSPFLRPIFAFPDTLANDGCFEGMPRSEVLVP